ncbi:PREDICTED: aldehyde oxidase GLOX-like [Tarenaya hassleriana]|uniref:aldehyde oxidase GLOX-like n=1 Tax=Tarenaya hassleriana TaxID=28532 RepID=UPI00053C5524|nr:PREDICTED: aldehyde oxidase GLOX-like [Tarenaya hassleriana]
MARAKFSAKPLSLLFISSALQFLLLVHVASAAAVAVGGRWQLLRRSIGISAMHTQLLRNDRVVMFDLTDFGPSNISLSGGKCRHSPNDGASKVDCTAHSVEYDVVSNRVRPLTIRSNTWCSSGSVAPDGTLIQTGGFGDGERRVRMFSPCRKNKYCDWKEIENGLVVRRWYASNHVLSDGRQIIVGGRGQFSFEFYPKTKDPNVYSLPFLAQTNDLGTENNLYPFVFLNVDGNVFIFANNRAILLDHGNNTVVKTYPTIPGGDPRSYPSTGSAVLLPLKNLEALNVEAEVLVCGGATRGAYELALKNTFVKALNTCARIKITDPNPKWEIETMPRERVMGDMTLLPNGHVLLINGGYSGTAAWECGREPVFAPDLYRPDNPLGFRSESQKQTSIPRMYHSTAVLLRDGRVLVGGSNPHRYYNFTGVLFPTDLSLEAFSPSYLDQEFSNLRPKIIAPKSQSKIKYDTKLKLRFTVSDEVKSPVKVTMVYPSFATHSFSMNQRVLFLDNVKFTTRSKTARKTTYGVEVKTPRSANVAPPGYYMMFVVNQHIPSKGVWVRLL